MRPPLDFPFQRPPEGPGLRLAVAPRLASWDRAGAASQLRLERFLAHVEARLAGTLVPEGPLTLGLEVVLPPEVDLEAAGDLDNFLYPVARRLGGHRLASAWASKAAGASPSVLRLEAARPREPGARPGWWTARVRVGGSATSRAWKERVRDQVAVQVGGGGATSGPLELELGFRVGPRRSWTGLWKQAIDSLGPVLGLVQDSRPFHPRDGRIVRLGLHRLVDPALGHEVELVVCWRELAPSLPEGRRPAWS